MKGGDIISKLEKRTLTIRDVSTSDDGMKVAGYVNKNGSVSEILSEDGETFRETILPQAFTNALDEGGEICFYLEHDPNKILATTKNGSLTIEQDDVGLHMTATIVPTSDGINAYKLIKSGIITNMSFGFLVLHDQWDFESNTDAPLRTVTDLMLIEVSAVKNPAYTSSTINARSKNNKLLDKSKINFRAKGGVKGMELSKFSVEDLKAELAKRDADKDPEEKEEPEKDVNPEPKEEPEKVEDDKLSQRDWYNLVMTVCRSKGIEPTEKRSADSDLEESEDEPKDDSEEEPKDESEKEPKEEPKDDSEKEDSKDESEDEPKDDSKDESEEDSEPKDDSKEERSLDEFDGLDGLLEPIK